MGRGNVKCSGSAIVALAAVGLMAQGCVSQVGPSDDNESDVALGDFSQGARPSRIETAFVNPDVGNDNSIENKVISLVDRAAAGTYVRAAFFQLRRVRVAQAFARAAARGVRVRIVLGETPTPEVSSAFGGARYYTCPRGACIGSSQMHNKFVILARLTDNSEHVVLQTSSNMTSPQRRQSNSAIVVYDDEIMHDEYKAYFQDLRTGSDNPGYRDHNYYHSVTTQRGRAYFYPRDTGTASSPKRHTYVSLLRNVDCSRSDSRGRTSVKMAASIFKRHDVKNELIRLRRAGCSVQLVVTASKMKSGRVEQISDAGMLNAMASAGVEVSRFTHNSSSTSHSKDLLIDGWYAGHSSRRKIVFTGSRNITFGSSDDAMLRIIHNATYDQFRAAWEANRNRARR